jgi:hypothetical protein
MSHALTVIMTRIQMGSVKCMIARVGLLVIATRMAYALFLKVNVTRDVQTMNIIEYLMANVSRELTVLRI